MTLEIQGVPEIDVFLILFLIAHGNEGSLSYSSPSLGLPAHGGIQ